jgi:hypothetical protein
MIDNKITTKGKSMCFLYFVIRSWLFTPAPWLTCCCYVVFDHGDLHQHLDLFFILLSIMVIYTSTLIFFLLLFCYRSWRFTPAPWFYFCCYFVIDDDYLHQHLDFLFVYIVLSIMAIYTSKQHNNKKWIKVLV